MASTDPAQLVQRRRGGCLTAFLILMLIANPLTALYYLVAGSTIHEYLPNLPLWTIPCLGLAALANFAFAIALWRWKKWGMYGFAVTTAAGFVINLLYMGTLTAVLGIIGVVILILLLRPVWNQME